MQATLNIAIEAAREAGKVIFRNMSRVHSLNIQTKEKNDFVSEVDLQAEREIINVIHRVYPQHGILGEESGSSYSGSDDEYQWIIDALLATGFPFKENQNIDSYLVSLKDIMLQTAGIRRAGSAALDLAYVAAGRVDGFWEFGLNSWDIAAGCIIAQEAGGLVGDTKGGHTHLETGNVVAANTKMFRQILQSLNKTN